MVFDGYKIVTSAVFGVFHVITMMRLSFLVYDISGRMQFLRQMSPLVNGFNSSSFFNLSRHEILAFSLQSYSIHKIFNFFTNQTIVLTSTVAALSAFLTFHKIPESNSSAILPALTATFVQIYHALHFTAAVTTMKV